LIANIVFLVGALIVLLPGVWVQGFVSIALSSPFVFSRITASVVANVRRTMKMPGLAERAIWNIVADRISLIQA
jgi:hypothetical protein